MVRVELGKMYERVNSLNSLSFLDVPFLLFFKILFIYF